MKNKPVYVQIELEAYKRLYQKAADWQDNEWEEMLDLVPVPSEICPACGYTMDIRDGRVTEYCIEESESCPRCGYRVGDAVCKDCGHSIDAMMFDDGVVTQCPNCLSKNIQII